MGLFSFILSLFLLSLSLSYSFSLSPLISPLSLSSPLPSPLFLSFSLTVVTYGSFALFVQCTVLIPVGSVFSLMAELFGTVDCAMLNQTYPPVCLSADI